MRLRTRWLLFALVAAVTAEPHPVPAQDKAVKNEIRANYARMEKAFVRKDLKALDRLLAPDFTLKIKTSKKAITRAQILKGWKQWFTVLQSVQSQSHTIRGFKVTGNKAVLEVDYTTSFTEDSGSKGLRKAQTSGPSRDTWIKSAQGWQWQQAQSLGSSLKEQYIKPDQHKKTTR